MWLILLWKYIHYLFFGILHEFPVRFSEIGLNVISSWKCSMQVTKFQFDFPFNSPALDVFERIINETIWEKQNFSWKFKRIRAIHFYFSVIHFSFVVTAHVWLPRKINQISLLQYLRILFPFNFSNHFYLLLYEVIILLCSNLSSKAVQPFSDRVSHEYGRICPNSKETLLKHSLSLVK